MVYTVTYRLAQPAFRARHDSRLALSEVKDIDDSSTKTIIITRHQEESPASPAQSSQPTCVQLHSRRMPAYRTCCCCGRYITHIYIGASPHQPYPHTMRWACRLRAGKPPRSTSDRWLGRWKLEDPSPARGAVGSLQSQKGSSSVRYPASSCGRVSFSDGSSFCFDLQNAWAWRDLVR